MSYIWYPMIFKNQTEALLNLRSEINAMSQVFAQQLSLKIRKTSIEMQKIDSTTLETYRMVVFILFVLDKDSIERFFKESFKLVDVQPNIVLGMLFLTMSNIDINFQMQDLQSRSYITGDIFLITRRVELIGKKEFAIAALGPRYETFVIYVATLNISTNSSDKVHPFRRI